MKTGYGRRIGIIALLAMMLLLLAAAAAWAGGNSEAVDLLEDPSFGLAHLNNEFHTVKGEDLLASPKFRLAHLNDEFHAIKEMLAELAEQVESLR